MGREGTSAQGTRPQEARRSLGWGSLGLTAALWVPGLQPGQRHPSATGERSSRAAESAGRPRGPRPRASRGGPSALPHPWGGTGCSLGRPACKAARWVTDLLGVAWGNPQEEPSAKGGSERALGLSAEVAPLPAPIPPWLLDGEGRLETPVPETLLPFSGRLSGSPQPLLSVSVSFLVPLPRLALVSLALI